MLPGLNPKKMQAVMRQMGINQEEISAERVLIEKINGDKLIIENPSVIKIKMQGQTSFQVSGEERIETSSSISEEDIKTVMEKTNCSEEQARKVLENTGDLAEAILELSD
jgi:nascent polypeptide-associated complex subunit alpha